MKTNYVRIGMLLLVLMSFSVVRAQQKEIKKTFSKKDEVIIAVSPISRYTITMSKDQDIHILLRNADDRTVEYTIREDGRTLQLGDKDLYYHPNRPTPHDIYEWNVAVPKEIKVQCTGSIAQLDVDSFEGSFSVETATGEITIERSEGTFNISVASGTLTFKRSQGKFNISAASADISFEECGGTFIVSTGGKADIDAFDVIIEGDSEFSTNVGDVEVRLSKTPRHHIAIRTGTGDGILDYNGNAIVGSFKFSAEKGQGKIVSPYSFDSELIYKDYLKIFRDEHETKREGTKVDYLLREQVVGNSSPEIILKTIRGRAVLKK